MDNRTCEDRKLGGHHSTEGRRLPCIHLQAYRHRDVDLPGWIPLGFDLSRIPTADQFQRECAAAVAPILAMHQNITLPEGSYRSESDKSAKRAKLKKNPPE